MDEGYCADALNFIMTVANVIVSCFLGLNEGCCAVLCVTVVGGCSLTGH